MRGGYATRRRSRRGSDVRCQPLQSWHRYGRRSDFGRRDESTRPIVARASWAAIRSRYRTFPHGHLPFLIMTRRSHRGPTRRCGRGRRLASQRRHPGQPPGTRAQDPDRVRLRAHSMVDDHSRLAYSEILPDGRGPRLWPTAWDRTRAAAAALHGAAAGADTARLRGGPGDTPGDDHDALVDTHPIHLDVAFRHVPGLDDRRAPRRFEPHTVRARRAPELESHHSLLAHALQDGAPRSTLGMPWCGLPADCGDLAGRRPAMTPGSEALTQDSPTGVGRGAPWCVATRSPCHRAGSRWPICVAAEPLADSLGLAADRTDRMGETMTAITRALVAPLLALGGVAADDEWWIDDPSACPEPDEPNCERRTGPGTGRGRNPRPGGPRARRADAHRLARVGLPPQHSVDGTLADPLRAVAV